MQLPDRDEAKTWKGLTVVDGDGERLGMCEGVFADTDTGAPEWIDVDVQDAGRTFVPALDAVEVQGQLRVRFARSMIATAPHVGDREQLSKDDDVALYDHYGVDYSTSDSPDGTSRSAETTSASPRTSIAASTCSERTRRSLSAWSAAGTSSSSAPSEGVPSTRATACGPRAVTW